MSFLNDLERNKIIAIVRGLSQEQGNRTAEALQAGGIRYLEVTMNTSGWNRMIELWREQYDGRMYIGAGTVLDIEMAKEAAAAGAQFLVTPNTDTEVIEFAASKGLPIIAGALTPTEIVGAWKAGATAVKLFPMSSLGIGYFKEVRAPLNQIRIVPTGGIHAGNMAEYIQAGAFGFGMGNSLIDKRLISTGQYEQLTALAAVCVKTVQDTLSSL